jgi:anti-sigma regulatory factor (Ser/Thr protein kinase)
MGAMTDLHRSYPAVKEAIAGIRHDVAAVASFLGANEEAVERVRLAVSEAATNIVQNVFEHTSGRIHVTLSPLDEEHIAVTVSDEGNGAVQRNLEAALGLGFIVMRECADALKLRQPPSGGVEVEMHFARRPAADRIRARGEAAATAADAPVAFGARGT